MNGKISGRCFAEIVIVANDLLAAFYSGLSILSGLHWLADLTCLRDLQSLCSLKVYIMIPGVA